MDFSFFFFHKIYLQKTDFQYEFDSMINLTKSVSLFLRGDFHFPLEIYLFESEKASA